MTRFRMSEIVYVVAAVDVVLFGVVDGVVAFCLLAVVYVVVVVDVDVLTVAVVAAVLVTAVVGVISLCPI